MHFDWYQATLMDDASAHNPVTALAAIANDLHADDQTDGPGRWGYETESVLRKRGQVVARMMHGGRQPRPSIWSSGDSAESFVGCLRQRHPGHRVSRCDAAQDYRGADAWDRLYPVALGFADRHRLAISQAGDWHRGQAGRTLYLGSRKSAVFARLYEKGRQLDQDPDWVRLELQVRPEKQARWEVAAMEPVQVWGLSAWSRKLLAEVEGVDVERVRMRYPSPGDDDRALDFALTQYGNVLRRLRSRLGSDEALGVYLGARLDA